MFTLVVLACLSSTAPSSATCKPMLFPGAPTAEDCQKIGPMIISKMQADGKITIVKDSEMCLDEKALDKFMTALEEAKKSEGSQATPSPTPSPAPTTPEKGLKPLTPEQKSQGFEQL